MLFPLWQVGITFDSLAMTAVALSADKQQWRLQGVWIEKFTSPLSTPTSPEAREYVEKTLQKFRKHLPKNHSIRTCLPAIQVIQHEVVLPSLTLTDKEIALLIDATLPKLIPHSSPEELVVDYRINKKQNQTKLYLNTTYRKELAIWLSLFEKSHLKLSVIDIDTYIYSLLVKLSSLSIDELSNKNAWHALNITYSTNPHYLLSDCLLACGLALRGDDYL